MKSTMSMPFKTRGPITHDDEVPYIARPADEDLIELVRRIDYVALIGPRLSGKTSMLMRLWAQLSPLARYALSYINLSLYSTLDEARWYGEVFKAFCKSADIDESLYDVADAIDLRETLLDLLEDSLSTRMMIIILDDVEAVPLEFRTAFFATLREMFVSRGVEPAFRRLSFILAGSYIPDELIPDPSISPFRVAEKVYVQDADDITPLVDLLARANRTIADDVPARIYEWTEGDLYLTQRLCERIDQRYHNGHITPSAVDQIVERYMYEDDIFDGLGEKLRAHPRVLDAIHDVVERETSLRFTRTNRAITYAWLLGCLKPNAYGTCIARNAIYDGVLRGILQQIPVSKERVTEPHRKEAEPLQGRYMLETVMKRGIITHLYRARDLKTGEYVVVKQLLATRGGDIIAWRRFQREGEALRRLNHPNIVKFIDAFRTGEYNYIVMEYVNGGTADGLLNREGRQPISVVVNMMLAVAEALSYAHEQEIVHRDLKPSNILLTQDLSPRVADFGVAHFSANIERITATYAIVGTPAYLCPEGYDNTSFTPAEDIWSLGVTMYELITGVLPFTGRTQDHIRHAVQHDAIPDVRAIRPDVPDALAQLIFQMLERDPMLRLPHGRAAHEALLAIKKHNNL